MIYFLVKNHAESATQNLLKNPRPDHAEFETYP
jgi:hypothetical protein